MRFTQANTRWNAEYTRLIRAMPNRDLIPGGWYTLRLEPVELIDGSRSTEPFELRFQVSCDATNPEDCPDQGPIDVARIDGIFDEETHPPQPSNGCGCTTKGQRGLLGPWMMVALAWRRRRRA